MTEEPVPYDDDPRPDGFPQELEPNPEAVRAFEIGRVCGRIETVSIVELGLADGADAGWVDRATAINVVKRITEPEAQVCRAKALYLGVKLS